jgi:hypothetical protein
LKVNNQTSVSEGSAPDWLMEEIILEAVAIAKAAFIGNVNKPQYSKEDTDDNR